MDISGSLVENYLNRLDELVGRYSDHIAGGGASDYPGYQNAVGMIAGVEAARVEFRDLLKAISGGDDDGYGDLA